MGFLAGQRGVFSGEFILQQTDEFISSFLSHEIESSERESAGLRERMRARNG